MCLPVNAYKVEREWEHAGLKCAVVQAREAAHRCGYVRVPVGHPLYGEDYDAPEVIVHGGLTFAKLEPCAHDDGQGWWFGFDCAHAGDASFDLSAPISTLSAEAQSIRSCYVGWRGGEHYWTQAEVEDQTEALARQLAAVSEHQTENPRKPS